MRTILRNPVGDADISVTDFQNIIFIAHSTGGIVVRNLLVENREMFRDKNVGLVLLASPSYGSKDADRLSYLIENVKNKIGLQLKWGNEFLKNLDGRFKNLVDDRKIRNLRGIEAIENHFIIKPWWWPWPREVVVTKESGGRYFGNAVRIPGTDHFSIVKASSKDHPTHLLLKDFYRKKMLPLIKLSRSNLVKE